MKLLPVGVQNFEQMITGNFVYVDKTRYLHEMVHPPQGFYFLARPRRFGKSLTVSTLDYLFQGRKDLFKGLYISGTEWEWEPHPVVKVDFSAFAPDSPELLQNDLTLYMAQLASRHGVRFSGGSPAFCFSSLLIELAKKYNKRVALLIDEYDKPIIEHLGKGEDHLSIARRNRDLLKSFFGVLKGGDVSAALRFVFFTGVSKFARVSIFSDLNNLNDLSMQEAYDAVLGYTGEELEGCFGTHITRISAKKRLNRDDLIRDIRAWYDGYRFTESDTRVYNPFSIVKFMHAGKFENYWFETGTPTFLVNLIRERQYPVADIEDLKLPAEFLTAYDLDRLQLEPLLFQTGYITINAVENELWRMKYPNEEVRTSFLAFLLNDFARPDMRSAGVYKMLHIYLKENKLDDFIDGVRSILGAVPYTAIAGQDEAYYHTVFFLMLSASGVTVHPEVLTSRGRMDMAVEFPDKVYVIELKCNQTSDKAIQQILDKRYYEKYRKSGKAVYLMGINFDTEKRTVDDWQWGGLEKWLGP